MTSHLKTLLEPLSELANKLVDKLKLLADGTTSVPMRLQFGEYTLNVISKVCKVQMYRIDSSRKGTHINNELSHQMT